MKTKYILIRFLFAAMLGVFTNCAAQKDSSQTFTADIRHQFYFDKSISIGIGVDKPMNLVSEINANQKPILSSLHQNVIFTWFTENNSLKNLYTIRQDNYLSVGPVGLGIGAQHSFRNGLARTDLVFEAGLGYKIIFIVFSRNIPVYGKMNIDLKKNNFSIHLNIPIFEVKK